MGAQRGELASAEWWHVAAPGYDSPRKGVDIAGAAVALGLRLNALLSLVLLPHLVGAGHIGRGQLRLRLSCAVYASIAPLCA